MVQTAVRSWSFFVLTLAVCAPSRAHARPTGEPQACGNCHYEKSAGPMITPKFSKERLEPGETITITLGVKSVWDQAKRAGFMVQTEGQGKLVLIDTTGTRLHPDGQVTHAEPKTLVNGAAEFSVKWTAPSTAGVTEFGLFSMTGNSNGNAADDHHAFVKAAVAHGCDAKTYHPDADKDGFGDKKVNKLSCSSIDGYVLDGRDCDDMKPEANPDAKETCNSRDDNCDGEVDEGLDPGLYYRDDDGDGYARSGGMAVFACNDKVGYTMKQGDCAPTDKNVHPDAKEIDNDVDDDCDGQVDEAAGGSSAGSGGSGGRGGSGGGGAGGSDEEDNDKGGVSSGCAVGGNAVTLPSLALLVLGLAIGQRRRKRS